MLHSISYYYTPFCTKSPFLPGKLRIGGICAILHDFGPVSGSENRDHIMRPITRFFPGNNPCAPVVVQVGSVRKAAGEPGTCIGQDSYWGGGAAIILQTFPSGKSCLQETSIPV